MDDAEWRLQHLTTTKEPLSTSQVALLFQGVASIQPADGMAQEFVVTVVKEDREVKFDLFFLSSNDPITPSPL